MSQVELRHLKTLVALRDTGSLVEAADRVFLTQSALSHQIKDLETRTGIKINRVEIGRINFLNDTARVRIYYFNEDNASYERDNTIEDKSTL